MAVKGTYTLPNLIIITEPGTSFVLKFEITGVTDYGTNNIEFLDYPIEIGLYTRVCIAGEEFTEDGRCVVCPYGEYNYFAPTEV